MSHTWLVVGLSLSLALFEWGALAQSSMTRVTLKSGQVLEGTVLEDLSGGGVRLILVTGETRDIAGGEIVSIARPGQEPIAVVQPAAAEPAVAPAPPAPAGGTRGGPGESCRARSDCREGLGCFHDVCATGETANERPPSVGLGSDDAADEVEPKPRGDGIDGLYGGGFAGGAVAPAFPGVAGVGGATGFFGWRSGVFDLRVAFGGFGASFPNGTLGFAAIRPEVLFFVAGPYGFGFGLGPCVGYYEDSWVGGGLLYGGFTTATPVALRFDAGSAFIEPSLSAGAIFGSIEQADGDLLARPAVLLGLAVYSK
jgi:hypothetical protein